jgi:hypothetical protein
VSPVVKDFLKRRLVPIVFIVAMAALIQRTCSGASRTHATIVLDFGDQAERVRAVDAHLSVDGEANAEFHRAALPGRMIGPCTFEVSMPADDGVLTIDVDLGSKKRHLVRKIHATEGATITVPLAADLAAP